MGFFKRFALQFQKPEGFLGKVAGSLMALTGAEKNEWTVSLLNINRADHVLEIGFGPGIAMELVANRLDDGKYVGLDYSAVMLVQAEKRNKRAVKQGKVTLKLADADDLPVLNMMFDKVLSVNSVIFWKDPVKTLTKVRSMMKPNGVIALTIQPFMKGATEETSKKLGNDMSSYLKQAGFSNLKIELKEMKPITAVCVVGVNE